MEERIGTSVEKSFGREDMQCQRWVLSLKMLRSTYLNRRNLRKTKKTVNFKLV